MWDVADVRPASIFQMLCQYAADVRPTSIFQMYQLSVLFYRNVFYLFLYRVSCQCCNLRNGGTPRALLLLVSSHKSRLTKLIFGKLVVILSASSDMILSLCPLKFCCLCYDLCVDGVVECDAARGGHAHWQAATGTLQGASL